jgi:hypothetical protein
MGPTFRCCGDKILQITDAGLTPDLDEGLYAIMGKLSRCNTNQCLDFFENKIRLNDGVQA